MCDEYMRIFLIDDGFLDIPPEEMDPRVDELIRDVMQWNQYRERYEE